MKVIALATPHKRHDSLGQQLKSQLPDCQFVRINRKEELNVGFLAEIDPQWIFFPHWSWVIPNAIHTQYKCVVFHMTDLPYGRGGSPLQNLIVRGHKTTKISALKCIVRLDAGPVYGKSPLTLDGTAEEILQRATGLIVDMIIDIIENDPVPIPQVGESLYFERRHPEDGNLSSLDNLEQVYDYIRMLDADSYPRAFIEVPHLRMEFSQASLTGDWVEAKVLIRRRNNE